MAKEMEETQMKNRNLIHKDDWATPEYILEPLRDEFGDMFDPCPLNAGFDALDKNFNWELVNFINPPYSQKLKESFIKKAFMESVKGKDCIMLLPVSTSTKIFHDYIYPFAEIRFLKGRVKFKGYNTFGKLVENKCGMHDSMIVIFSKDNKKLREKCKGFIDSEDCLICIRRSYYSGLSYCHKRDGEINSKGGNDVGL